MSRLMYSTAEVAEALGESEEWVRKELRAKRLGGTKRGRTWKVPVTALAERAEMPIDVVRHLMGGAA